MVQKKAWMEVRNEHKIIEKAIFRHTLERGTYGEENCIYGNVDSVGICIFLY